MRCRFLAGLLFTAFVAAGAPASFGQRTPRPTSLPAEIHGQVRYQVGGQPAENVLVTLESFGGDFNQILTDRTGKFSFPNLRRTQYTVTVHAPGYLDAQQHVDLETNNTDYVLLQLKPDKSSSRAEDVVPAKGAILNASVSAEARREYESGRVEIDNKNIVAGISHLEKAVSLDPGFYEAQVLLGTAYMDSHQLDKAEGSLKRAAEVNQKSAAPLLALGEVYRQQKKYSEAEKSLLDGLKLDNSSAQGHFTLGRVYWEEKEIVKAGPQVGWAIQLKPDMAEAHLLAGDILLRARQPENALTEFNEYLRLAPNGEFSTQAKQIIQKIEQALANKKKNKPSIIR